MHPRKYALQHDAADLLLDYAKNGCPVDAGEDWTIEQINDALERGPHKSAYLDGASAFLRRETTEKIKNGYARVVKWSDIKDNVPANLKISPVAMVPHKSKDFRCILDLSFKMKKKDGSFWNSVNSETTKLAKQQSMSQLGNCIKRITTLMADNFDPDKPFHFVKLDIKDGFWRMAVNNEDAWNFCYVLPAESPVTSLDDIEIVVPNSLQMGWTESPPYFCTATETARDVIEILLPAAEDLPKHPLEDLMMENVPEDDMSISDDDDASASEPPSDSPSTLPAPQDIDHDFLSNLAGVDFNSLPTEIRTLIEVFVDDFIAATNNGSPQHLRKLSRAMLHAIHSVFPPPDITGHVGGDPVSIKKIEKGEGKWNTTQEILGWIIDGINYTITLPEKKQEKIIDQINRCLKMNKIPLNTFQKLAGKLQWASLVLPGGWGLFSPLYMAMQGDPSTINNTKFMQQTLKDWRTIINQVSKIPTHVLQIVDGMPDYLGYCDACKKGCGGVWMGITEDIGHLVWQYEFPQDLQDNLCTAQNPKGIYTMNDLELIGHILEWLVLECAVPCLVFKHVGINCDNTSAVSWAQKYNSTKSIVASRLLRLLSLRMHRRRTSPLLTVHIAGKQNTMADMSSRSFKQGGAFTGSFTNLSDFFNHHFPLPSQSASWTEYTIPPELVSRVISCVRSETCTMGSLLRLPKIDKNTGSTGAHTYTDVVHKMSSSKRRPVLKCSSPSSALLNGSGQVSTVDIVESQFKRSVMRSRPSPRPSSWQQNVPPSTKRTGTTFSPSNAS